eukprot:11177358-Karenia_brevis.AAC.1
MQLDDVISFSAAIAGVAIAARIVLWQCGLLGIRVGEAAHPGPSLCPNCSMDVKRMRAGKSCHCSLCESRIDGRANVFVCDPCGMTFCGPCYDSTLPADDRPEEGQGLQREAHGAAVSETGA